MTTDDTTSALLAPHERVVKLTRALTDAAGKTITELRLREPEVGDLILADKFDTNSARVAAIIARQTKLPMPVIETMRARDFRAADKAIGDLMGNDPDEDGETLPS